MTETLSRYRLKQLILYIAERTAAADFFGAIKLNKVLYRSEFAAYRELGHKLTEFHYQKNRMGPTLRAFPPVTAEMESSGLIAWESRVHGRTEERRVRALTAPDLSVFSDQEIAIVDAEIQRAWDLTGAQVSAEEHQTAAWYATRMNETIKPELSFVEDPAQVISLSDAEQERAAAAIERYLARAREAANPRSRA
jgi:antitoxin SocA-like protein